MKLSFQNAKNFKYLITSHDDTYFRTKNFDKIFVDEISKITNVGCFSFIDDGYKRSFFNPQLRGAYHIDRVYENSRKLGIEYEYHNQKKNWQKNIDINLNGVFYCIKHFIKHHNKNKNLQKIITIGSIYGSKSPDHSIYSNEKFFTSLGYSASKFGLNGINTWVASKFGSSKIISNIVSPGGVYNKHTQNFVNKYNKNVALGRMCSKEDVFNAVNYLLSDKSNYINGQNIRVDGGYRI